MALLSVHVNNPGAIRLYQQLGVVAMRPRGFSRWTEDIMQWAYSRDRVYRQRCRFTPKGATRAAEGAFAVKRRTGSLLAVDPGWLNQVLPGDTAVLQGEEQRIHCILAEYSRGLLPGE